MTDDTTFHNGTVQRADFRLINLHCAIAKLLWIAQLRKELDIHKNHRRRYSMPPDNLDTSETTQMILKSTQTIKMRQQLRKKDFLLQISSKGIKVIDLTRPNELGTTMSKVATKSLGRTQL
jgi:heme oxygenase